MGAMRWLLYRDLTLVVFEAYVQNFNTGTDSCTVMKRMVCNNSGWKAANQSKD